jgi:predicted dehydrogenase
MAAPDVIITGVGGYGRRHLENGRRRQQDGQLRIVALVDPAVAARCDHDDDIPIYADLDAALQRHRADIVTVATPLDTHRALAEQAMLAGADVYLEKPAAPTLADFERLLTVQRETGRAVQVGFQSLGSEAIGAFAADALGLGPIVAVGAAGLWSRSLAYWDRARWAGRRTLDGHPVVDGVATNPLAHAVATALRIAGYDTAESVAQVEAELFRANRIEADDTSSLRISGAGRPTVTCALTLCAPPEFAVGDDRGATVTVTGERGSAVFSYTTDVVTLRETAGARGAGAARRVFGRVDLLENLLDHRENGAELIVPLGATGAFLRVVEAVRLAPQPAMIDPEHVSWQGEGEGEHPIVDDIERIVRSASGEGRLFSELGAPWATGRRDAVIATARLGDTIVAEQLDGRGTTPFSSPHPFLHPVRTLHGVTVTATHPADHDWHTGVGFAVQDADGVNFWGGRTYLRDLGYQALDDHGRIEVVGGTAADGVLHELVWRGPDGAAVLAERRGIRWRTLPACDGHDAWALGFDVHLTPGEGRTEVTLRSPGSKGRAGAGYGGFFWRLPDCVEVDVFTAEAAGEDAVNGSRSPWLAWTARFLPGGDGNGEASLVLAPADDATAGDPWFVRLRDYPGVGSAVAWDSATQVSEAGLTRRYRVAIVDGRVSAAEAAGFAAALAKVLV